MAKLLDVMKKEGVAQYPKEACGLIIQVGRKSTPVVCQNIAEVPERDFRIAPDEYVKYREMGKVVGVWHTHVNQSAKPSAQDIVGCDVTALPWYILAVVKNEDSFEFSNVELLKPSGKELPYIGRPYLFGVTDCWSLIRDYYEREYQIILGDYPRIESFWKKGHNFFDLNWKEEGFTQLIDAQPNVGDLFLIKTDEGIGSNHIAVYIGNDLILHHCHGRLSRRDIYGGHWQKHTTHHLRHKELM